MNSECGMRNAERKKEDRVLNAECGMRNVELKKVKGLIFISWSLSPTRCAIITSWGDYDRHPVHLVLNLKPCAPYHSLFSAFRIPTSAFMKP